MLIALQCCVAFAQTSDSKLQQMFQSEWDYEMQQNPTWASLLGDRRWNDRWDDLSLQGLDAQHKHHLAVLERLRSFQPAELSPTDQINYAVFYNLYSTWVEEDKYRWYLVPEHHMSGLPEDFRMPPGVQSAAQLATNLRFETAKDYQDWNTRLATFPAYVDQVIALMREGMRNGMMNPKVVMKRIPPQVEKLMVPRVDDSLFFKPFLKMSPSVPPSQQQELAQTARTNIERSVVPSLRRFNDFLVKEYIPAAPDKVGIWQMPSGSDMYAFFVRKHTTTDLTPEQVHQLGLSEVKRIRAEMDAVLKQVGFKGTLKEFFVFLRTDPRFYYKQPNDLLIGYRNLAKQIDPKLLKIVKTLPRAPYGVEPTPAETAPDATTGFYFPGAPDGSRPGTYLVNLYRPETRPKWEMLPLTLHEAVPGHHLQLALAMEMKDVPNFRRFAGYAAYSEGWALYSETRLGYDMNLYNDLYDRFGQLTYEMWRAVRLVVDTGMHSMHWTRQQAIEYFLENSPRQELDITNEVDRYIAMPGQALAYKIGELKIGELRKEAEKKLGPAFDLRSFHDAVLAMGPVPLNVLQRQIENWISSQQTQ
ncbi:MAG TPA: DUF885 domain-containing protein [Bryobacteraceae bacterium]|nr:DUF885 domain-containing protein [Bryobacteraceae bacterium]